MYAKPQPMHRPAPPTRPAPLWHRAAAALVKGVVAVGLLAGGLAIARQVLDTAPVAARKPAERGARLVAVAPAEPAAEGPAIRAWGVVEPARRLVLRPEVGGRVAWVNPALAPGGVVAAGEVLVALDDRDILLEIAAAEAEIARIDAQIRMERGQAARALADLERSPIGRSVTPDQRGLILREPQMAELEAARAAAAAGRDAAGLRAARTIIRAPFDAIVESEELAEGTYLTAGAEVARLASADRFRVALAVPQAALAWLDPEGGQTVRLGQPGVWPEGAHREGRLLRLGAGLTATGRMAELIAEIEDPLARRRGAAGLPRLLLGSFVEARIAVPALAGAVAIDRAWLRDGDTLWVMDAADRLALRRPEIAWRGAETVLATGGIAPGERIVTSPLAVWAEGMALRTAEPAR